MHYETFNLHSLFPTLEKYSPDFEPILTAYLPSNSKEIDEARTRPTIIVCPGGGYCMTSDREAEPVALAFVNMGFNAFVLRYSCTPAVWPAAFLQLSASISFVRNNAEQFHVNKDAILVCGFSAGGHLTASGGVFWNEDFVQETLGINKGDNKPNGLILCYPVISSSAFGHQGSIENLLNGIKTDELVAKMSLENQVNSDTPPCFIWHTFDDNCVPVENSLAFAKALKEENIPFELHIFPQGVHGLSLCDKRTGKDEYLINNHAGNWVSLCEEWINLTY